ncbi:MAG: hypothetical protein ACYC4L_21640 [Chloroflexota bacterium]
MITTDKSAALREPTVASAPGEAAAAALESALEFTARRLGGADAVAALRAGSPVAHDYFRYGLALRVGEWLAAVGGPAEGIYLYDSDGQADEMENEPLSVTSPLELIVWVRQKSAVLAEQAVALDEALSERYRALRLPGAEGLRGLLQVSLVDDEEVAQGGGPGARYARPQRVWPFADGQSAA